MNIMNLLASLIILCLAGTLLAAPVETNNTDTNDTNIIDASTLLNDVSLASNGGFDKYAQLIPCQYTEQCGNGKCDRFYTQNYPNNTLFCFCENNYVSRNGVCNYKRSNHDGVFAASIVAGYLGADWFALARGNDVYIGIGVAKLCLTLICAFLLWRSGNNNSAYNIIMWLVGAAILWWLIDWIRAATKNGFPDGNGYSMGKFSDQCGSSLYYLTWY